MRFKRYILLVASAIMIGTIVMFPKEVSAGIVNGILVSGNILIPSLFPFAVISAFIFKSGVLIGVSGKRFGTIIIIYVMSAIGGYPIGAKIINDELCEGRLDEESAEKLLDFCVNCGPSFVITFVGYSVFGSRKIGLILLVSHLLSSFEIMLASMKKINIKTASESSALKSKMSSVFVESVAGSASTMINICSYVILFSGIISLIGTLPFKSGLIKSALGLIEVTNALLNTKNIYHAAFILGFGGFCIIFQTIDIANRFIKCIWKFILFRVIHGVLSCINLYLIMKILKITVPVFSNCGDKSLTVTNSGFITSVLLVILSIILIYSLSGKKHSGKLSQDIL